MNAGNYLKTPIATSISRAGHEIVATAIQKMGKALPCTVVAVTGQIVTVNFAVNTPGQTLPQVRCPIAGPEYIRMPTQVGDKGVVFPADVYIGGVSGLGGGVASMTPTGNLSTLVFFPIGNTAFTPVDPNAVTIYGPDGVVLRDTGSGCVFTLTSSGIVIKVGGMTATFNAQGITVTGGEIDADGIGLKTHFTPGVTVGTGTTTVPPVAGAGP